jgi:Brp/Blh family beta-carotene 15,15'-monooxygenase
MSTLRRPATVIPWPAGASAIPVTAGRPMSGSPAGAQVAALRDLRCLTVISAGLVGALLVLSVTSPAAARSLGLPIAVVGALLGVPHGAVDHLLPWWWGSGSRRAAGTSAARSTAVRLGIFTVAYAAVAALALGALLFAPTPTLVIFFALSAFHFGRGEVQTSAERAGRPVPRPSSDRAVAAAHGLVVVGLLFWVRPAETNPLLAPLSPWLAHEAVASRSWGLALVTVAGGVGLARLLVARRYFEAAELALLAAVFSLAPPLAAFGVYFGGWHAVRHTGRLLDLARRRRTDTGHDDAGWGPAARLLARSAVLPTLAALVTVAALWWGRGLVSLQAEVGVLLALTFPHAAVVWALDRHEAATVSAGSDPRAAGTRPPRARPGRSATGGRVGL